MKNKRISKQKILDKFYDLIGKSLEKKYLLNRKDAFALGYMFGKYDLKDWSQKELIRGCKEYDKLDDLGLLDTIGETLIDLDYLDNSKREI